MADEQHPRDEDGGEPQRPADGAAPGAPSPGDRRPEEPTREQPSPSSPADAPTTPPASGPADTAAAARAGTPANGLPSVFGEGRYRILRRLGRGGMAEVYAAQDVRLGRTVAIKVLRPELAEDRIARSRFTREAHSVASLNHHAVVAVYDTGEEQRDGESVPYIVMELVEGRTVRELLQSEQPPPVDQALIITAGILEALAYSHRHGIVHRDIKPANVIITASGAVKVMDFGIARALTGATSTMTQTGMVMGTPQYLSPEQALGKPVDHRSDLYATGCMLYELLALRPPFTGDTPLSVVYQHVQDMPVPPSQANPRVPAGLDPLVLRALAKDPDDRYQTADEFRAHVQHALRQMHAATGVTEVLPPAALAAAEAAPTTKINSVAPPPPVPTTPQLGTPVAYQGEEAEEEQPERRSKAVFAVIAVLVGVAAVALGIALALNNNGHTPTPGTSSQPPSTSAPAATSAAPTTASSTPTPTQSSPASSPTPTPSRTRSTPTSSPTPTTSPTTSPTSSPTPTESASPTSSPTPSSSPSATPSSTSSGTASGTGGGTGSTGGGTGGNPSPTGSTT